MITLTWGTISAIVSVLAAGVGLVVYVSNKQDKKSCYLHSSKLNSLELALTNSITRIEGQITAIQMQITSLQKEVESMKNYNKIMGRLDGLEGLISQKSTLGG